MKRNIWISIILITAMWLFSKAIVAEAQEEIAVETPKYVPLTDASKKSKLVYAQLMQAVYSQAFNKDIAKAKSLYDELVVQAADSAFVWYKRGKLHYMIQNVRGAEKDTREALKLDPSHVAATWQLAQILADRATHAGERPGAEVLETLKKVVELDAGHIMAHHMLANLAYQHGELDIAVTSFKALTRVMPFEPTFHSRLGDLYQRLEKPQEAIDAYKRVIKINPDDMRVLKSLGYLYLTNGALDEAQQIYQQILSVEPQDVRSNLALGLVLQEMAQRAVASENNNSASEGIEKEKLIQDAEKYLGRAIFFSSEIINRTENQRRRNQYNKILVDAQFALANVYFLFENLEKAEELFLQVLENDSAHVNATYLLGAVYQTMDAFEKAEKTFRKVLSFQPTHADALNALGYLYAERGINLDEAEALIKRALQKFPKNGAYLDSLGWVFFKQGRIAESITTLESANQQMPNNVEVLMHLGDAYHKNGESDKANRTWQQALTIEPDNSGLQERLKQ